MKNVVIYGAYDSDNLGDDYMMFLINDLLKKNNINPYFIKRNIDSVNYFKTDDIKYVECPLFKKYNGNFKKVLESIKWFFNKSNINNYNALIFMGGGYTSENFGLLNLVKLLILKQKYIMFHKKIFFTGQTVGPNNKIIYKYLIKKIYKNANKIFVREEFSLEYLNKLKLKSELVGDDAFLTEFVDNVKKEEIVIFNYKDFLGYNEFRENYFNFLLNFAKKINKNIIVMPFKSSKESKEYKLNYMLYKFLTYNNINASFVVEKNIEKLQEYFAKSKMVIGTAYHSIVLGLMFNNEVFSFYLGDYYKKKITGILKWYNYDKSNCMNIRGLVDNNFSVCDKLIYDSKIQETITKSIQNNVHRAWQNIIKEINK